MFEGIRLIGSDEEGIPLFTREKRQIDNSQAPAVLDDGLRRRYNALVARHPAWVPRKPACGTYNCFGHVWASRRTAIYDEGEVQKVLKDDGYRQLPNDQQLIHGDLVLYYQSQSLCHVGVVCELRRLTVNGSPAGEPTPWVLSKWNDSSGEVLHHWNDVPYEDFVKECWTDRP